MIKCEVLVDRVALVVGKGSIVNVDEKQFELARQFIKPIKEAKAEVKAEEDVVEEKKPKKKK
jgi:hypothetical protein